MKKTQKLVISVVLSFVIMLLSVCTGVYAADTNQRDVGTIPITTADVSAYQAIIDKLNKEYGYSMTFDPVISSRNNTFKSPTEYTLDAFEAELRKEIEEDIAVNQKSQKAIAELGDVQWKNAPFTGKVYTVPVNVSYMSSHVADAMQNDMVSYMLTSQTTDTSSKRNTNDKTLSSAQPKLTPDQSSVFVINTTISIPNYWKYTDVLNFSVITFDDVSPTYVPTGFSYSLVDSDRTVAASFSCRKYSNSGVLVNANTTVFEEYHATGDCITNSPNYTIPRTVTNKTYNHIPDFTDSQNCAGYAWNHNAFVHSNALGITYSELNDCSSLNYLSSLVKSKSMAYMSSHGITANVIRSYDTIINTTLNYRVVMRVGYDDTNGNGEWDFSPYSGGDEWDYHWWMQLGDGSWADKRGGLPSRIVPNSNIYDDPDDILWTTWYFGKTLDSDFYNSTPAYFKITG